MTLTDEDRALTYEEAERLALLAIHDVDGRGMVGRGRNHLHQRVARALLSAARQASTQGPGEGWQPIETAPRDALILLYGLLDPHPSERGLYGNLSQPTRCVGYWDEIDDAWCPMGSTWEGPWFKPTHWRPLPAPPASQTQEG